MPLFPVFDDQFGDGLFDSDAFFELGPYVAPTPSIPNVYNLDEPNSQLVYHWFQNWTAGLFLWTDDVLTRPLIAASASFSPVETLTDAGIDVLDFDVDALEADVVSNGSLEDIVSSPGQQIGFVVYVPTSGYGGIFAFSSAIGSLACYFENGQIKITGTSILGAVASSVYVTPGWHTVVIDLRSLTNEIRLYVDGVLEDSETVLFATSLWDWVSVSIGPGTDESSDVAVRVGSFYIATKTSGDYTLDTVALAAHAVLETYIAESPSADGTGALAPLAGSGVGQESFLGSGGGAFAPLAGSGTAQIIFGATGSGAFAPLAAAATGQESFSSSGTGAFAPLAGSGVGHSSFSCSGGAALAPLAGSGTAFYGYTATGTGAFAPLAGAGTSSEAFLGSGSSALAPLAGAGTGQVSFAGTGTGALAPLAAAATGSESFASSGSAGLAPLAATATGSESFSGSGSSAAAPLAGSGTATMQLDYAATGTAAFAPLAATGTASESFSSSGGAALAPLAGSGSAGMTHLCTGTAAFASLAGGGTASIASLASGSAAIAPIAASGSAIASFAASGSSALAPLAANGDVVLRFLGDGAAALAPFAADGNAGIAFASSGSGAFAPLAGSGVAETDLMLFFADGTAYLAPIAAMGTAIWVVPIGPIPPNGEIRVEGTFVSASRTTGVSGSTRIASSGVQRDEQTRPTSPSGGSPGSGVSSTNPGTSGGRPRKT